MSPVTPVTRITTFIRADGPLPEAATQHQPLIASAGTRGALEALAAPPRETQRIAGRLEGEEIPRCVHALTAARFHPKREGRLDPRSRTVLPYNLQRRCRRFGSERLLGDPQPTVFEQVPRLGL